MNSTLASASFCFRQGAGRFIFTGCVLESTPTVFSTAVGFMTNGEVVFNGGTVLRSFAPATAPAFEGQGTVIVDPSVTFGSGIGPSGKGINTSTRPVPETVADPGTLGGNATATATLPANTIGALVVGFPGIPVAFPGVDNAVWLAPGGVVEAMGSGTLTGGYAVPNMPFVVGVQICWQAVAYDATSTYAAAGNPASYTHLP